MDSSPIRFHLIKKDIGTHRSPLHLQVKEAWNIFCFLSPHKNPTPGMSTAEATQLAELVTTALANPMDGGAWWAAVHGVAKSRTRLSDFTFTFHFHALEKEMASHSSVLAWRIPGTGEPGGLLSMGSHRVGHD